MDACLLIFICMCVPSHDPNHFRGPQGICYGFPLFRSRLVHVQLTKQKCRPGNNTNSCADFFPLGSSGPLGKLKKAQKTIDTVGIPKTQGVLV